MPKMPTYPQIREFAQRTYSGTIHNCHIAHVKSQYGLTTRMAPNRKSPHSICYPCPEKLQRLIESALRKSGFELVRVKPPAPNPDAASESN